MKNLRALAKQCDDGFKTADNEQEGPRGPKGGKLCLPPAATSQKPAVPEEVVMLGLKA